MSHEGWARRRTTAIVPFYWNRADIGRKSAKTLSSCRLDLNTKQLAERRTAVGIAQLDDPIRPGFVESAKLFGRKAGWLRGRPGRDMDRSIAEQQRMRDIVGGSVGGEVAEDGNIGVFAGRKAISD